MIGPGMFDGVIALLILIGIAIGLAICGIAYGIYYLFSHITIGWV